MTKKKVSEFRVYGLERVTPAMFRAMAEQAALFPYPEIRFDDVAINAVYVADPANMGNRQIDIIAGTKQSVVSLSEIFDYLEYLTTGRNGVMAGRSTIIGHNPTTMTWMEPVKHISLYI